MVIGKLQGRGDAADPEEQGGVGQRAHGVFCVLGVPGGNAQEGPRHLRGEQLEQDDAQQGDGQPPFAGGGDGFPHPPVIPGGVVEGDDGQHALADADVDGVGQALHLHHDADARQHQVAVGGGQAVEADVGQVKQAGQHGGGDADGEKVSPVFLPGGGGVPEAQAQGGFPGGLFVGDQQVGAGESIGKGGGDGRAGDLLAPGQQDEHEQRVQQAVEDPAGAQAEAGLARVARVPQQMGQGGGEDGRQTADDDDDQGVAAGIADGLVRCAKEAEQRVQKKAGQDGIEQGDGHGPPEAEGADLPGPVLRAAAVQPGDQTAPADAQEVRQCDVQHDQRQRQRGGRGHVGVAGPPDKIGVHHVIDQVDQLTDDGRYGHGPQGLGHRDPGKQFLPGKRCRFHGQSLLMSQMQGFIISQLPV